MLDMAPFLKDNSRLGKFRNNVIFNFQLCQGDRLDTYYPVFLFSSLGCQIILHKGLEGIELTLPQATRNFYVDGHVPEPH